VQSDNLLMQRQYLCFPYNNIVNLLFLGGVTRDSQSTYFTALISYDVTNTSFLMWGGLSLAKDKVLRDMLGIYPSYGEAGDLLSLYAAAPYSDTSVNVNGSQDWTLEASSEQIQSGFAGWFYYTQLSRPYDTGDSRGDEVIMYKMNNQYCFAAYFTYDTSTDFTYTDNTYMHQLL
jgi:hypothetical protein